MYQLLHDFASINGLDLHDKCLNEGGLIPRVCLGCIASIGADWGIEGVGIGLSEIRVIGLDSPFNHS